MFSDLERAVMARNILVTSTSKHKQRTKEIDEQRNALLMQMTLCEEGSIQYEDIERQIEILDKREYDLHVKFKKILRAADKEINESIGKVMERYKRSRRNSDSALSDAPDNELGAT